MRKVTIVILLAFVGAVCFGQSSEVVVRSSEMVQISTGGQSPNITEVGTATIYYCQNVTYCGPSLISSGTNTYSFVSTLPLTWSQSGGLTSFASSSLSQPSESGASSLISLRTASWTPVGEVNADNSDSDHWTLPSHDFTGYGPVSTPFSYLDLPALSESPNSSTMVMPGMFLKQIGLANTSGYNPCLESSQPQTDSSSCRLITAASALQPTLLYSPPPELTQILGSTSTKSDYLGGDYASAGKFLMASNTALDSDTERMLARFTTTDSYLSQPTLALASMEKSAVSGGMPAVGIAPLGYSYSGASASDSLEATGLVSAYKSTAGFDGDSLSRQLADLTEHGAKIGRAHV